MVSTLIFFHCCLNFSPTERASHPSRAQVELLTEFLGRNPSLAKGFSKIPSARDASRKSWEAIAVKLNSLGGCDKSWKQWTKVTFILNNTLKCRRSALSVRVVEREHFN